MGRRGLLRGMGIAHFVGHCSARGGCARGWAKSSPLSISSSLGISSSLSDCCCSSTFGAPCLQASSEGREGPSRGIATTFQSRWLF